MPKKEVRSMTPRFKVPRPKISEAPVGPPEPLPASEGVLPSIWELLKTPVEEQRNFEVRIQTIIHGRQGHLRKRSQVSPRQQTKGNLLHLARAASNLLAEVQEHIDLEGVMAIEFALDAKESPAWSNREMLRVKAMEADLCDLIDVALDVAERKQKTGPAPDENLNLVIWQLNALFREMTGKVPKSFANLAAGAKGQSVFRRFCFLVLRAAEPDLMHQTIISEIDKVLGAEP